MIRFVLLAPSMVLLLAGCAAQNPRVASTANKAAALHGISMNPLQLKLIMVRANRADVTISNLFGNNSAVEYARLHDEENYPAGSQLFLVTWHSQEDSSWFGGRIPATPRAVEVLEMRVASNGRVEPTYSRYEGAPLKEVTSDLDFVRARAGYILSLRAAVLP